MQRVLFREDRGLVDAFGGFRAAIAAAAEEAGLDEGKYRVRYVEPTATPFEQFFANFLSTRMGAAMVGNDLGRGLFDAVFTGQVRDELAFVQRVLERNAGKPVTSVAHCFCAF